MLTQSEKYTMEVLQIENNNLKEEMDEMKEDLKRMKQSMQEYQGMVGVLVAKEIKENIKGICGIIKDSQKEIIGEVYQESMKETINEVRTTIIKEVIELLKVNLDETDNREAEKRKKDNDIILMAVRKSQEEFTEQIEKDKITSEMILRDVKETVHQQMRINEPIFINLATDIIMEEVKEMITQQQGRDETLMKGEKRPNTERETRNNKESVIKKRYATIETTDVDNIRTNDTNIYRTTRERDILRGKYVESEENEINDKEELQNLNSMTPSNLKNKILEFAEETVQSTFNGAYQTMSEQIVAEITRNVKEENQREIEVIRKNLSEGAQCNLVENVVRLMKEETKEEEDRKKREDNLIFYNVHEQGWHLGFTHG